MPSWCRATPAVCIVVLGLTCLCGTAAADPTVIVSSIVALQRALQDPAVLRINLTTSLRLAGQAWTPVTVDRNVTVAATLPGIVLDLDLGDKPVINTVATGWLQLESLTLVNFTSTKAVTAGSVVDQLSGAVAFLGCVFLTSDQQAFGLLSEFQEADPGSPQEADEKRAFTASFTTGGGRLAFVDSTVVIDSTCSSYVGGVVAFDSASLLSALTSGAARIYLVTNVTLSITDFTVNSTAIDRPVDLYSCRDAILNLNSIRYTIAIVPGGAVTLRDMSIAASFPSRFANSTPPENALFLGAFKLLNSSLALVNSTLITDSNSQVLPLSQLLASYPSSVKPLFNIDPAGTITIPNWRLAARDWEASQGRPSVSTSSWRFQRVQVVHEQAPHCFDDYPGIQVRSDVELQKALLDGVISHIQIMNDIVFDPAHWPPEASGPNDKGINITRTIDIRACHPEGGRYILDFGNIGQVIFVYGHVRFFGDIQIINSKPSARRAFLYALISAMSVETDGIIEFENVTINGTMPSPLHDAKDTMWAYQQQATNIVPSLGAYTNASYYQILLDDYVFDKAVWVQLSQGRTITGTGYWRFTSVTLQWWPAQARSIRSRRRRLDIMLPSVFGGLLLLTGLAAAAYAATRRSGRQAGAVVSKGVGCPQDEASTPTRVIVRSDSDDPDGAGVALPLAAAAAKMASDLNQSGSPRDLAEERIEEARRGLQASARQDRDQHLVLEELLGEGSFGRVYRGYWRGTLVAVKAMLLPPGLSGKEKREKMAIMEAAISSSLSHPNVVQTYTYIIKQLSQPAPLPPASKASAKRAAAAAHESSASTQEGATGSTPAREGDSSRPLLASEQGWEVRLVQEYCDKGSLRDALDSGLLQGADGGVDMLTVVETALDVAHAMVHLHDQHILHSDLKARNILLKSSATEARGFTAKVADFGLSLQIPATDTHISNFYQGTMTHMAPEVLLSGKLSRASDVYAYAVLLWELYTGEHAFKGVPRAYLGHEVAKLNKRPELPASCPFEFRLLVYRCWESDAAIRPTFHQILEQLKRMKAGLRGPHASNGSNTIPASSHPTVTRAEHSSVASSASVLGSTSSGGLVSSPTPAPQQPPATPQVEQPQLPMASPPPAHAQYGPASWDSTSVAAPPSAALANLIPPPSLPTVAAPLRATPACPPPYPSQLAADSLTPAAATDDTSPAISPSAQPVGPQLPAHPMPET